MPEENGFEGRIQRIEKLIQTIDNAPNAGLKEAAKEIVGALMDLQGVALERMMQMVAGEGDAGQRILDQWRRDDVVRSLLLLYGLHPLDLETRVLDALEKLRTSLQSRGSEVELVSVADGVVRLRLGGTITGCSVAAVKASIEEAIYEGAPDLAGLFIEGLAEERATASAFVPLARLMGQNAGADSGQP